jgi:hypothetical protein
MKFLGSGTQSGILDSHIKTNPNYSLIRPAEAHLDGSDHSKSAILELRCQQGRVVPSHALPATT